MDQTTASAEGFTAQCGCGKRYRVAAEKRGRKLKCHACGGSYTAEPAPPRPRPTPAGGQAVQPSGGERASGGSRSTPAEGQPVPSFAGGTASAMSRAVPPEPIDPSPLLKDVSRGNLPALLAIALVIHLAIIGLTSVSHISLCMKYGTLWPKPIIKQEREEEEKRKLEEKQAQQQKALEEKQAADTTKRTAKKGGPEGEKPKSRIEQTIDEKSDERPTEGTIRLDDPASLE